MFIINLTPSELQNLKAFLMRVNLSAKEVNSFVGVMAKITNAKEKPEEKKEEIKK